MTAPSATELPTAQPNVPANSRHPGPRAVPSVSSVLILPPGPIVDRHRRPQERLQAARRPPAYPNQARIIAPVTPSHPSAVLTPSTCVNRWIRAKQKHLRHLGGWPVRHAPGRSWAVLCSQRRPVPEGRRSDRHGDALQRPTNGPVHQVARWCVAGQTKRQGKKSHSGSRPSCRLRLQDGLGLGTTGAQHLFPVPASVVFARRSGEDGKATALAGVVERWLGNAGAPDVHRSPVSITDTSVAGDSPYAGYSRQGASIVPRCLFFVEEADNLAIVRAGQTVTANPRRGSQDKEPWRSLDLYAISEQTVEASHVFEVHLGETLVPYPESTDSYRWTA